MKPSPQITFKNLPESDALKDLVYKRLDRLDRLFPRIIDCHVLIESPHRHHYRGNHIRVRVELYVPGKRLVVSRDPDLNSAHKDAQVAVRDSFNSIDRQLQDYARELRGDVKTHSRSEVSESGISLA